MRFDFSGVALSLEGLPRPLEERLRDAWSAFPGNSDASPLLAATVEWIDDEYPGGLFSPKRMRSRLEGSRACFSMSEGEAEVRTGGEMSIRLVRSAGEDRAYYTLLNMIRACLAWVMPARGGLLMHAAGLVVGSRAFMLVGSANAGKSTWARLGEKGGARVLSDDVVLLDREPGGMLVAVGAPLFSTHRADYRPGRWPLAAVLYPEHGDSMSMRSLPTLLCHARLLANLPFISEAIEDDSRIAEGVDRMVRELPQRIFTFALESDVAGFLADWRADDVHGS